MRYIVINEGPNRAQRRKSRHDSINNKEMRRKGHRMNRPEKMEMVSQGNIKIRDFFGIK